jgi:hypothetical protein
VLATGRPTVELLAAHQGKDWHAPLEPAVKPSAESQVAAKVFVQVVASELHLGR